MSPTRIAELREETVGMFYHGFDNYMDIAFPEDEVRFHSRQETTNLIVSSYVLSLASL